jgi:hypothetical protein
MNFIKYSKDKSKIKMLLRDNPRFRTLRREVADHAEVTEK